MVNKCKKCGREESDDVKLIINLNDRTYLCDDCLVKELGTSL